MGFQPWLKLGAAVLSGIVVVGCQNTHRHKSDPTFAGGPPIKGQQTIQTPPPSFPVPGGPAVTPGAPGNPAFPTTPGGPAITPGGPGAPVGPASFNKNTPFPSAVGGTPSTTTVSKTGTTTIGGSGVAPIGASGALPPGPGGFNTPGLPPAPGAPSVGEPSSFGSSRTTALPGGPTFPGGAPNVPPPPTSQFGQ